MAKLKMVCPYCESEDIRVDAWAKWNVETQDWELNTTFDASYCANCNDEIKYFVPVAIKE